MREGTFDEELLCALSEAEQDLRGRQNAHHLATLRRHQAKAKLLKKELAAEEKRLTEAVDTTAEAVRTGFEKRQVKCFEALRGVMVEVIRTDLHETVSERPATAAELKDAPDPLIPGGGGRRGDLEH